MPTRSSVDEVHRDGLSRNEEEGSAVVTGPVYPYCCTSALTLVILANNSLAVTQS
jgi:hypothetical protein